MLLKDKVAIVTGGTRGIGFEIVRKYLQNSAKVVLFGSKEETVRKALIKLREENEAWEADGMWPILTDAKEVEAAILQVKEKYGRIDILVNNAGISQSTSIYEYTAEEFDKIIGISKLKAIHINDSMNYLGCHKDRHQKIGQGAIGIDAFERIINHKYLKDLPYYLETPNELDGYKAEIALLKKYSGP